MLIPEPNLPESDLSRLEGRTKPSEALHSSMLSNGKHIFSRVVIVSFAGNSELSLLNDSGAIEIGNSGSFSDIISAGAHETGSPLSPREKSLADRCLAMTSRDSGLPSIDPRTRNFA